jgi:hypothetical protein
VEKKYVYELLVGTKSSVEISFFTSQAVQICEIIWRKKWTGYKHLGAQCFQYMLAEVVNNKSCKKTDVKRLVLYKEIVDSTAPWIAQALPNMAACLINKTVLSDGSSPGLLSRFFMLNVKCIEVLSYKFIKYFSISTLQSYIVFELAVNLQNDQILHYCLIHKDVNTKI